MEIEEMLFHKTATPTSHLGVRAHGGVLDGYYLLGNSFNIPG